MRGNGKAYIGSDDSMNNVYRSLETLHAEGRAARA